MAKFTEVLPETGGGFSPVAPVQPTSNTAMFSDLLSSGMSVFSNIRAAEQQRKTGEAITNATTSILDLQDETINQQLEFEKVSSQVAGIHADGEVTQEEQVALEALKKQIGKFDLLDPNKRQVRMNALHRQALSDVKNLGIQTQINSLFGQGRSNALLPISNREEEFKKGLDLKYGAGNWGPIEEGRELGKKVFMEEQVTKARTNINSLVGEGSLTASQVYQDVMVEAGQVYAAQGHLRDDQTTLFIAKLEQQKNNLRQALLGAQKQYADAGIDTTEQIKGLMKDVETDFDNYTALFRDKGLFGDSVRTKKVVEDAVATMDKLRELRLPVSAKAMSTLIGGGSGGGIKALQGMLNASDGVLTAMMEENPSLAQLGSPKQLRENMATYIAMTLNPMSVEEGINQGYIAPQLAKVASANFGIRNSDTPEQLDNNLAPFDRPSSSDTVLGELQALNARENVNKLQTMKPARLGSIAIHKAEAINASISPSLRKLIRVNERGVLEIPIDEVKVGKANAKYFNTLLAEYSKYVELNKDKLGGAKEEWYKDFLDTDQGESGE